jgi:small subunit ribosomal protein S14
MAKTSKRVRNDQRRVVVERYQDRRRELKSVIANPAASLDAKTAARAEMSRQPRDASATRLRNRDAVDGRPRGFLRTFGVSRIRMRQLAHAGELSGVTKASW